VRAGGVEVMFEVGEEGDCLQGFAEALCRGMGVLDGGGWSR
jgi:hypothetical protein